MGGRGGNHVCLICVMCVESWPVGSLARLFCFLFFFSLSVQFVCVYLQQPAVLVWSGINKSES